MRICLINPPDTTPKYEDFEYNHCFSTIPHIGLGYIGAVLQAEGYEVDIIECIGQQISVKDLFERLVAGNYQAIGISTYYYNLVYVNRIVKKFKSLQLPGFIFLGGHLPSLHNEIIFKSMPEIDCCVLGEGEYTTLELMAAIQSHRDWRLVQGIAYLDGERVVHTPPRSLVSDLDQLPVPIRTFVCKNKMVTLITHRGCYGKCIFCGAKEFYERCPGKKYRFRSPEKVVAEIEYLIDHDQIEFLFINDDNFLGKSLRQKKWLEDFYRILEKKQLKIEFRINARADEVIVNREILKQLRTVGLNGIFIGIESFVQRQLDFFQKSITVADNIRAIQIVSELGLKLNIGFIIFDPFTTLDEILTNLQILQSTEFSNLAYEGHLPISLKDPLIPIMGTPFHDLMKEKGLLNESPILYDFCEADVALFYQGVKRWNDEIFPVYLKYYLIYEAKKFNELEVKAGLKQLKADLLKLDLVFMEELGLKIQNGSITTADFTELIEAYRPRLNSIAAGVAGYEQYLKLLRGGI